MNLTKEIQSIVGKDRVLSGHVCVCENVSGLFGASMEMDLVSMSKSGYIFEYEIKITRGDFLADKKKKKWSRQEYLGERVTPNYFFYVCPESLIQENEVPEFAGLYWIVGNEMKMIKGAKKIHSMKHDREAVQRKITRIYQERHFLGKCLLTYKNDEIKKRNQKLFKDAEILHSNN